MIIICDFSKGMSVFFGWIQTQKYGLQERCAIHVIRILKKLSRCQCARKFHFELSVLKSHSARVGVLSAME